MDGGTKVVDFVIRDRQCSEAAAEPLWREHGWGLNGRHVAVIVAVILAASAVLQLFG